MEDADALRAENERLTGQLREVTALTGDLTPEAWTRLSDVQGYVRCGAPLPEVKRLRGLIEGVEFEFVRDPFVSDFRCPWCNGESKDGHTPDCPAFSARGEVRR